MTTPALSVCIPTYNRARYLERLLARLSDEVRDTGDAIEVVVSDNASPDDTRAVCADSPFGARLRYFRHDENVGAEANLQFAISQARGKYSVYLADDDILIWPGVNAAIEHLEASSGAIALYAPWYLVDLERNAVDGQFYEQPTTEVIAQRDYLHLARHVLAHQVFSEIFICRTDVYRRILPGRNDLAFWAFTVPCELLAFGSLVYASTPFYGWVTRHPGEDARSKLGNEEVQVAWDRYRGGVEHLIGLARSQASPDDLRTLLARCDRLVQDRMLVALRLRLATRKDPVESYFLASRLRGLGRERDLPASFETIRSLAAIHALGHQMGRTIGAARIVLAGAFSPEKARILAERCGLPVAPYEPGCLADGDLVLISGDGSDAPAELGEQIPGFAITETDLLAKFP